jgi:hypothetical protein
MQSPYIAIANRQAEIMMRIASEFGFAPAQEPDFDVTAGRANAIRRSARMRDSNPSQILDEVLRLRLWRNRIV